MSKVSSNSKSGMMLTLFFMKAFHIIGIFIASYLAIIMRGFGYSGMQISLFTSAIGLLYPITSVIIAFIADKFGRIKTFRVFKLISLLLIVVMYIFSASKMIAYALVLTAAIENGLETLIYALATERCCSEEERSKDFQNVQLGSSIGMVAFTGVAIRFKNPSINTLFLMLIGLAVLSFTISFTLENLPIQKSSNAQETKGAKGSLLSLLRKKTLIVCSLILVLFSIASSQLNYGFPLTVSDLFGQDTKLLLNILLCAFYSVMFTANLMLRSILKKYSCILNMIVAGIIYSVGMTSFFLIENIVGFMLGVVLWAIAQYMINVNNTLLISKSCEKNNIALVSAVFPMVSGSGTVLGPLLGGIIVNADSVHIIWLFNMILVMIGTVLLYILDRFIKKGSNDSTSKTK